MNTTHAKVTELFQDASDPVIISQGTGLIVWANTAAQSCISSTQSLQSLSQLLGSESVRLILTTMHFASFEVTLLGSGQRRMAVVTDVSSGDPDDVRLLVVFKIHAGDFDRVREREEFLAGIAHDLKNPLSAIYGYADVCLDTALGESLNERQREIISKVRNTALRSIDLIRNYQLLVQMQLGGRPHARVEIDLNFVVTSVINTTWRESAVGPRLQLQLSPTPLPLFVDRMLLDRIISNLVGNAASYTPPSGLVRVKSWSEGRSVLLEVFNSGSFIPPDEIDGIFERYTRASSSNGTSGSGLGLFLVKKILNEIKGSIQVESQKDVGTTFRVRFEP